MEITQLMLDSKHNKTQKPKQKTGGVRYTRQTLSKKERRARNSGIARWRPKHQHGGVRIGEAAHPGPCQHGKGAGDCYDDDCRLFLHFHRPAPATGAKKRKLEDGSKPKKRNPARWTICTLHLMASECGVEKPHGHCTCAPEHHPVFQALLEKSQDEEAREEAVERKWDTPEERRQDKERTRYYESDDYVLEAHRTPTSSPDDTTARQIFDQLEFSAFSYDVDSDGSDDDISDDELTDDECLGPNNSPKGATPPLRSTEGVEPAVTVGAKPSIVNVYVNNPGQLNPSKEVVPSKEESAEAVEASSFPEAVKTTRKVYMTGEATNVSVKARIQNWFIRQVGKLPLTRTDDGVRMNKDCPELMSECFTPQATTTQVVKGSWRKTTADGWKTACRPGQIAVFKKYFPTYVNAPVYLELMEQTLSHSLVRQGRFVRGGSITQSMEPTVIHVLEKLCKKNKVSMQLQAAVFTQMAIMNQLFLRDLVRDLAIPLNVETLDFRSRGQRRR